MAEDTWNTIDKPVLEAIRAAEIADAASPVMLGSVRQYLSLPEGVNLHQVLRGLEHGSMIQGRTIPTGHGPGDYYEVELMPEGRRATGQWPTPEGTVEALVEALRAAASTAATADERSSLERAADSLQVVLQGTAAGLVVAALKARVGL